MQLILNEISKSFTKDRAILDKVSLEIEDGEFVVFLGPSGCGKTTLLRIIAGLETEDSGDIIFDNIKVNNFDPKDRQVGMVFQNYALYPHMTVFENIAFPLKVNKIKSSEMKSRVKDIANFIGLNEYLNYKPKQLSGGQRQRVALGRAISREPKLFLFDEPLSNLDAKLRSQMRIELYNLHRKLKTTSIYVTHDQVEAMTMGDRIVVLNKGKIQQIDTPLNIYENPSNVFVATFIGTPQINLFPAILTDNKIKINFNKTCFELNIELIAQNQETLNQDVTLGIRPENLSLYPKLNNTSLFGEFEVYSIEFMGNETIINFKINDEIKSLRCTEKVALKQGDKIELFVNNDKIMIFDRNENKIY